MSNPVSLINGFRSLFFIVRESKYGTIYGGDECNKKMLVISNDSDPVYIDMDYGPQAGILTKNDSQLIVGGYNGNLSKFSLDNPTSPVLITNIKLPQGV